MLNSKYIPTNKLRQKGVVLFMAMIALVVMSLAAVALIRSVDTNSQIAGNLAFRQSAITSSSYGIEYMADTIGVQPAAFGEATSAGQGYYATCETFDTDPLNRCDGANLTLDANWQPGVTSGLANGLGVAGGVDAYGNTIQYIVERMSVSLGNVSVTKDALLASSDVSPSGLSNCTTGSCPKDKLVDIPVYRVTVRIAGPKNTVSYIQAFIS